MSEQLTRQEWEIYTWLVEYLSQHAYQPSVREIGRHFGIPSTRTVFEILRELERKGYIERQGARARGVKLRAITGPGLLLPVPYYNAVSIAAPALNDANRDGFMVLDPRLGGDRDTVAVRTSTAIPGVLGGLRAGDILLINPSAPAANGSLVLAVARGTVMVRTIEAQGTRLVLHGSDSRTAAVVLDSSADYEIVGVVTGVYRAVSDGV